MKTLLYKFIKDVRVKRTVIIVGILLLAQGLFDRPFQVHISESLRTDPALTWLLKNYPPLMTNKELQAHYQSLIAGYWVPQTGLYLSFPGTGDERLVQQAATYDQGIVGVLLVKMGDHDKARKLLKFYENAWEISGNRSGPREGHQGLANFYNAYFGVEGVEKTMHVGPNAWIGLFATRYYRRWREPHALKLATHIADWMIDKVPHREGAIAMGEIPWNWGPWDKIHSTENNISTLAFLNDLLLIQDLSWLHQRKIRKERDSIEQWLIHGAYDKKEQRVIRGFNPQGKDRVGAVDSYTWYINMLRPRALEKAKIPVDKLMHFADKEFCVNVDGRLGVDCVDQGMADATFQDTEMKKVQDVMFLRPKNNKHRLIWYEGQGQFIVLLQDMARYSIERAFAATDRDESNRFLKQGNAWFQRAKELEQATDKASFQMPWGIAYPCATQGQFYLWGWPAPSPNGNRPSDAVAPLVWRIFSGMGYESLSDTQINPRTSWHVKWVKGPAAKDPGTDLLLGASEEMTVHAWELYEKKEYERATRQAKATIKLWEADAKGLEVLKEKQIGTYLPYNGKVEQLQRIHDFWALNDVAAAYFVLAKIADEEHRTDEAIVLFRKILKDFPLAQLWDKRGWFWNPVTTIQSDYAETRPNEYGSLLALIPEFPAVPKGN